MNIPIEHFLLLGAFLFCIGLAIIIIKRSAVMTLLGIELMMNASNVNLIGFNLLYPEKLDGQIFSLFIIVIAVCEAAIGLAIILRVYQNYRTSVPDQINTLRG